MPIQKDWEENKSDANFKSLSQPQKNAVIFLAAIAVFVVVFWVWQISAHIKGPFDYKTIASKTDASEEDYNRLLRQADTDKDGLSDYDEIYIYKTSPYLEDTDSDGLSDKQEVDSGNNPVCPQGKDCGSTIDTSAITSGAAATSTAAADAAASLTGLNSGAVDETALQQALSGVSDAATLRQLLISSGASAEDLSNISDADLMRSYQETLQNQSQSE